MNPDQVEALIQELKATEGNPKGAVLNFHTSVREYEGRTFDSTICFVKAVQEVGTGGVTSSTKFVKKTTTYNEAKVAKVAREIA